jgi:hypothetical protein
MTGVLWRDPARPGAWRRSRVSDDNPAIEKPATSHPSQQSPAGGRLGWPRRAADWIVPVDNPSGAVYGVIIIGALLAAESGRHESYLDTEASAVLAAGIYWLAHAYATVLGRRLGERERLTPGALVRALAHDWTLVRGAAIPIGVLLVAWVTGASQATGVTAALWSVIASLLVLELIAGIRSRVTRRELALELGVGVALGVGILAMKILLH